MSNFNIISFTELMQCGNDHANIKQQNNSIKEELPTPSEGVFIQDVNGNLWKTKDWDGFAVPNAIAVIADESKFLIALAQSYLQMSIVCQTEIDRHMFGTSCLKLAVSDYDGAGNTANILKLIPSTSYAAGYCNSFTYPNGKTKGYLPSLGQLKLAHKNKGKIEAALKKCGGTAMELSTPFWSSTFRGVYGSSIRSCWLFYWGAGGVSFGPLNINYYVRSFADLT